MLSWIMDYLTDHPGEEVEVVSEYKNLGNKLDWSTNSTALYKEAQSQLYFLRSLKSFNIWSTILQMFYGFVVASVRLSKPLSILHNFSNPIHSVLAGWSVQPETDKCQVRHRRSFLPVTIKLYNNNHNLYFCHIYAVTCHYTTAKSVTRLSNITVNFSACLT